MLDFTEIQKKKTSFCASKVTIKKVKRRPREQEEILVNHMSGKGLYLEYIKNIQPNNKKANNLILKWAKDL